MWVHGASGAVVLGSLRETPERTSELYLWLSLNRDLMERVYIP